MQALPRVVLKQAQNQTSPNVWTQNHSLNERIHMFEHPPHCIDISQCCIAIAMYISSTSIGLQGLHNMIRLRKIMDPVTLWPVQSVHFSAHHSPLALIASCKDCPHIETSAIYARRRSVLQDKMPHHHMFGK